MIRSPKNGFPKIGVFQNRFFQKRFLPGDFRKGLEKTKNVQKIVPKIYLKKSGAKIQPKSQAEANTKSIQISKQQRSRLLRSPQKWGGALRAPPHFWGCCFEI